jgi:CBS domain-containing protein
MAQTVADIMTANPRTLRLDASVRDAARLMRDADIGPVIVLDEQDQLSGIVTDRDLAIRAVADGMDLDQTTLREVASQTVTTVSPDDDAMQAVRMMREQDVRRLPVVENGKPVGIVSIGDLAVERAPGSALGDISTAPPNS